MDGKKEAKFDSDDFGPSYVMAIFVPTQVKSPGVPLVIEYDADTPGRGSVYPEFDGGSGRWFR